VLTEHSHGADTAYLAYYNPLLTQDLEKGQVRCGPLGDAPSLFDNPDIFLCTRSNLWATDRSWVVSTDYDPWGTKVFDPAR